MNSRFVFCDMIHEFYQNLLLSCEVYFYQIRKFLLLLKDWKSETFTQKLTAQRRIIHDQTSSFLAHGNSLYNY